MAYGAIIAAIIGGGLQANAAKESSKGIKAPQGFDPIKFARASRINALATYFPEELENFQISYEEARRLYRQNPAAVHRIGPPMQRGKKDKGLGRHADHARHDATAIGNLAGAAYADKVKGKAGRRRDGLRQLPRTRFFRVPTSEEFSQIANKAFSQATKEAEVNAQRLRTSELYRPLFERAEGRLGEFGRRLDTATEDLASRALGVAATRGTLSNPAVAARATAPIALARAQTRQGIIDSAQNQIRVLSAGNGLQPQLAGSLSQLGQVRGQNLGAFTAALGAQASAQAFRASMLSDAGGSLSGAFGYLRAGDGGGGGGGAAFTSGLTNADFERPVRYGG